MTSTDVKPKQHSLLKVSVQKCPFTVAPIDTAGLGFVSHFSSAPVLLDSFAKIFLASLAKTLP
jgi:hypothetical protein